MGERVSSAPVVVLAAMAEPADPALDEMLGAERAAELRAAVAARALEVAASVGEALVSDAADASALGASLAAHTGPVLLLAPDVPGVDEAALRDGLADLEQGCLLSLAPATDGRAWLLALAEPSRDLLALAFQDVGRAMLPDLGRLAEAHGAGGVGLLRAERRLVTPGDAHALALDPLADPALRALAGHAERPDA